jgi:predicted Rossmann fold flavoprotein
MNYNFEHDIKEYFMRLCNVLDKLDIKIIEQKPSLVGLNTSEKFDDLSGTVIKGCCNGIEDDLLFTHFGVSGPMVLSASSHLRDMEKGRYIIYIDLKPALDFEQLDARILRDFSENTNKNYINSLGALLPRKLIHVVAKLSGIKPTVKVNQITREERHRLVQLLKEFKVTVKGFRPIDEAIITSGGIDVKEISPKTMESKIVPGIYFAEENALVYDVSVAYRPSPRGRGAIRRQKDAAVAIASEVDG